MPTLRMTRRVSFSAGHRYWLSALSEEENRALFGKWASPFNHGHNYVLDVTVQGEVDAQTGMVVNIKRIDDLLKEHILASVDQKSLNDEVSDLANVVPCVENLLRWAWGRIAAHLPPEADLVMLRLEEMPLFYGELDADMLTLTRVYEFAAAHRLHVPDLSEAENEQLFGKCNNPAGHGHNYLLEVTVEGEPDAKTGMTCDLTALDTVVAAEVVDRYDHKHLNLDIPEFLNRPTTSEVVAQEIFARLQGKVPGKLRRIRLHETARNIFEVTAS